MNKAESRVAHCLYQFRMLSLALGIMILSGALAWAAWTETLIQAGVSTTGAITALDKDKDGFFHPSVTYQDASGNQHTARSALGTVPSGFVLGEVVPVLYPKNHPEAGTIATWWELWFGTAVCAAVGVLAVASGISLGYLERYVERSARDTTSRPTPSSVPDSSPGSPANKAREPQ